MPKLALVGGPSIQQYTVADQLWALISKHTDTPYSFEVITLATEQDAVRFFTEFCNDDDFRGFNVALPYKSLFASLVQEKQADSTALQVINTVYKYNDTILCDNTDPLGILHGLSALSPAPKQQKTCLILGAGGAGLSTAQHLTEENDMHITIYDPFVPLETVGTTVVVKSLAELSRRQYDVVINATPLGKYHFDTAITEFSSPLNRDLLKQLSHLQTVVIEMNYLPYKTLTLQIAESLDLQIVPGVYMLTYQALESWSRYFDKPYTQDMANVILEDMIVHIQGRETNILKIDGNKI